jgi:acetolactate synthase-1/2/3 large subunit
MTARTTHSFRPLLESDVGVRQAVVRALEDAGVDMVFGMPGGYTVPIYDALLDSLAIRTVLVREESLAGVMAEVYGRLTGKPAVAMGQAAFLLAAGIGALEAHLSSSPMLLLTDFSTDPQFAHHGPYQSGSGMYGSWDARNLFASVCKEVFVATGGAQTVQCVQLAVKHALAGQRGPVAVLFPIDAIRGRVSPDSRPALYTSAAYLPPEPPVPSAAAIHRIADRLLTADRPVIIAGGGVRIAGAYDEIRVLAETLAAPVVTTASGKSAIAETHELAAGVFGNFGTPLANAVVAAADVVLVVGSKLAPSDTANENPELLDGARQTIIQIDIEALNASWTFPTEQLIGDARVTLAAMIEAVNRARTGPSLLAKRRFAFKGACRKHGWFDAPELTDDSSPPLPQRVISEIQHILPDDAFICCDAGENRIFMTHYFQTKAPGTFVQPAGVGAMGYAIPAAMAARLAFPERAAVAVCGDGGFGIAMNGLMSALEEDIPITVVILNNAALGWVKHGQGERVIASDLGDFDHAAIAQAMGCAGYRVERTEDLAWALQQALQARKPAVVDVRISFEQSFTKVLSPLATARPKRQG